MKITDVLKTVSDDDSGELTDGKKRTYATGTDVPIKVTLVIEYPTTMDVSKVFTEAEEFMHKVEDGDQLNMFEAA